MKLLEIVQNVKNNKPVDGDDLRLAIVMLDALCSFYKTDLDRLLKDIEDTENIDIIKFTGKLIKNTFDSLKTTYRKDPKEWLSKSAIPGTEENLKLKELYESKNYFR